MFFIIICISLYRCFLSSSCYNLVISQLVETVLQHIYICCILQFWLNTRVLLHFDILLKKKKGIMNDLAWRIIFKTTKERREPKKKKGKSSSFSLLLSYLFFHFFIFFLFVSLPSKQTILLFFFLKETREVTFLS